MNLTEATILALQGKLNLEENKKIIKKPEKIKKEEAININTDEVNVAVDTENKVTSVDTEKETIVIAEKEPEEVVDVAVETDETIDVPVEGDETIVPEEEVSEETVDEIIDEEPTEEVEEVEEQEPEEQEPEEEIVEESKELKTENFDHIDDVWEYLEKSKNEDDLEDRIGNIPNKFGIFTYELINDEKTARVRNDYEEYGDYAYDEVDIDFLDYLDESKTLKTESDATPEFLEDLKNLLNKHTRVGQIDKLELDETGDKVIVTYPNGATKEISIVADSNTAAIKDILKVVESKEIKPESENKNKVNTRLEEKLNQKIAPKYLFNTDSFDKVLTEHLKKVKKGVKSFKTEGINIDNDKLKIIGKINNRLNEQFVFTKKFENEVLAKYTLKTSNLLKESKEINIDLLLTKNSNELTCKNIISK